ncbi:cell wall-binding repeat-containing protein [Stomatohabitans albus]|uniref:cell wall-binding repeat-containing protein n=1 Tax=Stomatohabitans albus TaxID=3110766 RepID=UPI00300CDEB1
MIRPTFLTLTCATLTAATLSFSGVIPAEAEEEVLTPATYTLNVAEALETSSLHKADGAQGEQPSLSGGKHASGKGIESDLIKAPNEFSMVAATFPQGATLEVRRAAPLATNKAEETDAVEVWGDEQYVLSPWYEIELEPDKFPEPTSSEQPGARDIADPIWVEPGTAIQIRVDGAQLEDVKLQLLDTERNNASLGERLIAKASKALAYDPTPVRRDNDAVLAVPGAPKIVTRQEWKADESMVRAAPSYASKVTRAVVHHTSGSNSYTRAQSAGIVRGILQYHAGTRGWSDIGYNFLVDKYGTIYEGRAGGVGRGVIGAHAQGFNTGTVGISTLGTFNSSAPPAATQNAVAQIIGWKSKLHGFDPAGRSSVTSGGSNRYPAGKQVTLNHVIGHRDVGYTDCPGDAFYPLMSRVASRAKTAAQGMGGIKPVSPRPPFANNGGGSDDGNKPNNQPSTKPSPSAKPSPGGPINLGVFNRVSTSASRPAAAVEISQYTFKAKEAKVAVIAREDSFADAMAGGPLAGKNGPLLLTNTANLSPETNSELKRVLASGATIYVLGGTQAVSDHVVDQLGAFGRVKRLRGSGRIETSVAIAKEVLARSGQDEIMIAREGPDNRSPWADALSGGAWGAAHGIPVVLNSSTKLSPQIASFVKSANIRKVHLLGGTSALSGAVSRDLPKNAFPVRHSGKDRTETATAVANLWGSQVRSVVLANGFDGDAWVWALAAAPLSARTNSPLLLSGSEEASQALNRWASGHVVRSAVALGDRNMLTDKLLSDLNNEFRR